MKNLTIYTLIAIFVVAFCEVMPSIAQTTTQSQDIEQTSWLLEDEFKKLSESDRFNIQSRLSEYDLYTSTLDGLWGRNTANALHQAAAMMEQNMGEELNLVTTDRARTFLRKFVDGSASAFMWGEGGECDGCNENDQQELQPTTTMASEESAASEQNTGNHQRLEKAIFNTCLKNAHLMNQFMTSETIGLNSRLGTYQRWAQIGLSMERLGIRHISNHWQAVDEATLVEACKEQAKWADVFGSEIQFLGKRIIVRDLAYRDQASSQLSDDLTLFEKHSVAVYPLTRKEIERLNGNHNDYEILGVSFHLIEKAACRGSQSSSKVSEKSSATGRKVRVVGANTSTTPISNCEEVRDVFMRGQPFDLSEQSRCFVNFHLAPNTGNVSEEAREDPSTRAFTNMGGYAVYTKPFGLNFLYLLSQRNNQDWQGRGAWFLESEGAVRNVSKVLDSATDAFEGEIDWDRVQKQLDVTTYKYVTQHAEGRAESQIVGHPSCLAALSERRNAVASHRVKQ